MNLHLEQSSYRVKLEEAYENILGFSEHVDVRTVVEELGWKILGSKTVDVKIREMKILIWKCENTQYGPLYETIFFYIFY